ncbi:uncharacterized protein BT62DRAFT_1012669 [Guyanagaster necrorhizus]|uniref:Uncharacterized protein n=1 Tax=Guyanagaster necrorhizus TaxID=856835 RepID=A0A9P8AN23_9AGAR|nr:uncharacterized protein BT62DRAFT_1012669 [Guyanagaster necrorhizus MCA 3950]KAG7440452.1 hypothetical protein BT62DRAFT_1012669 [Guyanagaster necrorhizus MCA 3950]
MGVTTSPEYWRSLVRLMGPEAVNAAMPTTLCQVGICSYLQWESRVGGDAGILYCQVPWFVYRSGMTMMISLLKIGHSECNDLVGVKVVSVEHQKGRWMQLTFWLETVKMLYPKFRGPVFPFLFARPRVRKVGGILYIVIPPDGMRHTYGPRLLETIPCDDYPASNCPRILASDADADADARYLGNKSG